MAGLRDVLGSVARLPRWLVVDLPCRFWLVADDHAPTRLWRFVAGWVLVVGAAGGVGAMAAAASGGLVQDGFFSGLRVGLLVVLGWIAYAVLFLLLLWFRAVSPSVVLDESLGASSRTAPAGAGGGAVPGRGGRHLRHAPDTPWRRPGEPLLFPVRRRGRGAER